jgi:hypothetical protein
MARIRWSALVIVHEAKTCIAQVHSGVSHCLSDVLQ